MTDQHPTQSSSSYTITRDELVQIIDRASEGCAESTRRKLRAIAETTEAVTAGWFHCDGVGCPARQALGRRTNQRFQQAYDVAMFDHFGRDMDGDYGPDPFVVRVTDD